MSCSDFWPSFTVPATILIPDPPMKKCPHCHESAIGFVEWGQGLNAFRTRCRSCGQALRATKATYVAALVTFIAVVGGVVALAFTADAKGMNLPRLTVIPIAIGVSLIAYRFCGYEKNDEA